MHLRNSEFSCHAVWINKLVSIKPRPRSEANRLSRQHSVRAHSIERNYRNKGHLFNSIQQTRTSFGSPTAEELNEPH